MFNVHCQIVYAYHNVENISSRDAYYEPIRTIDLLTKFYFYYQVFIYSVVLVNRSNRSML